MKTCKTHNFKITNTNIYQCTKCFCMTTPHKLLEWLHGELVSSHATIKELETKLAGKEQEEPVAEVTDTHSPVPAGWERTNFLKAGQLYYVRRLLSDRWKEFEVEKSLNVEGIGYEYITQTININIDISKQPEEFVAWAMDDDGRWYAFQRIPKIEDNEYWADTTGDARKLLPSEYPTNHLFKENWKDSLLVRPEAVNPQANTGATK